MIQSINNTIYLYPYHESYESPFSQSYRSIIREVESISLKTYLSEVCTNDYQRYIINEAVENNKSFLVRKFEKFLEIIKHLAQRFVEIAMNLIEKNKLWLKRLKEDMKPENVPDDYTYPIYPYWKNMNKLIDYKFPEFQETNPQFLSSLENEEEFKRKYFRDLYINKDGQEVFDPKAVFRGGFEKINMTKQIFLERYKEMVEFVTNYKVLVNIISNRNNKIIDFIKRTITRIKSTLFRESDYINNTINILLEQSKPTTSNDLKKDDKREEGKSADTQYLNEFRARETYNRVVYSVNSARMIVVENCYNDYLKALFLAIRKNLRQRRREQKEINFKERFQNA